MKPREFKLNMAFASEASIGITLARLRRYIRQLSPKYQPAKALRRRRFHAAMLSARTTGGRKAG